MTDTITCGLTPVQENVIAAIAGGATMQAAAAVAGIHRNTIGYWGKTSVAFRGALQAAQYDKALSIREEAGNYVTEAFAAIHDILTSAGASDAARLNAAKYIIEKASTPPPHKPDALDLVENVETVHSPAQTPDLPQSNRETQTEQIPTAYPQLASNCQALPARDSAHSRPPKVGRNESCPCGSHLKFKRCCLGKPGISAAA